MLINSSKSTLLILLLNRLHSLPFYPAPFML
nr:MAG TPA: hypothetical protein [Caudoviricetes sp.]